ncbi:MAG: bifunctional diguanylate cyclase/phosphodiesterase [Pseudomonadota bacterium]
MTRGTFKTQAIIWLSALGLAGLMNAGLYLDHLYAQRAALVSSANDLARKYTAFKASGIDPASLNVGENYVLGVGTGSMDYRGLFEATAAREDSLAIHEGTYKAVRKSAVYRPDGTGLEASTKPVDSDQATLLQRAIETGKTQSRYVHDNGRFARHRVETFTAIGAGGVTAGVYRVDVDKSVLDAGVSKVIDQTIIWLGGGLNLILLIATIFLSMGARRNARAQKKLEFMANHDGLTGLRNRHYFNTEIKRSITNLDGDDVLFLGLLNINRFKEVNDQLGHMAGDDVLRIFGSRCEDALDKSALIARISADEFAVLQPGKSGQSAAFEASLNDCLRSVSESVEVDNQLVRITASAGVAQAPADSAEAKELIKAADLAMQHAKKGGETTLRRFDRSMAERMERRRQLERDMRIGIERGHFVLFYQPQLDLGTGALTGYEALIRWKHPTDGMISPGEFIPLAEETGMIKQLGRWVVEQACEDALGVADDLSIAVNISALQFELDSVSTLVAETLARTGLPPHRLEIEVTESVLVDNRDYVASELQAIAALGCGVAIDDFGTGYSSLTYLADFPFTKIKIDRSFVIKMEENQQAGAIVSTIIALGQSLGAKTIAEGVETEEQAVLLRAAGCQSVQGFLYGRPEPLKSENDNQTTLANAKFA